MTNDNGTRDVALHALLRGTPVDWRHATWLATQIEVLLAGLQSGGTRIDVLDMTRLIGLQIAMACAIAGTDWETIIRAAAIAEDENPELMAKCRAVRVGFPTAKH